jgi:hypothetical protein
MTTDHERAVGWAAGIVLLLVNAWLILRGSKR